MSDFYFYIFKLFSKDHESLSCLREGWYHLSLNYIHSDGLYFEFSHDKAVPESPLLGKQKRISFQKDRNLV